MKKPKKTTGHSGYLVVPNRDWKTKVKWKGASVDSDLIRRAAEATRKKRKYKLVKDSHGTYVVVVNKASGHLVSKFKVDHPQQSKRVRKFSLKPKRGTISAERIFKAI